MGLPFKAISPLVGIPHERSSPKRSSTRYPIIDCRHSQQAYKAPVRLEERSSKSSTMRLNRRTPVKKGSLSSCGSAEAGFARDMQVHHDQGVELAMIVRDRTDDPDVRLLA